MQDDHSSHGSKAHGFDGQAADRNQKWGIVVSFLGFLVSAYATYHHVQLKALGATDAFCNISDKVSCDRIAQSQYSEFLGFPIGAWGMGYFVACMVLLYVGGSKKPSARPHIQAYYPLVLVGVLVSVILGGISAFAIGVACPTCMVIYAICAAQAVVLFLTRRGLQLPIEMMTAVRTGGGTAVIAVAGTILAFNLLRPSLTPAVATNNAQVDPKNPNGAGMMVLPNVSDIPLNLSAYSGLGEDYRRGAENPKVTVVEFADFQCPACQQVAQQLHRLHDELGSRVLLVFKNYPLDQSCNSAIQQKFHEHACQAAILARCAGQYGKFWNFHDLAYEKQSEMSKDKLRSWAQSVGLNDQQIDGCLAAKDIVSKIQDDLALANKLGVEGTPTLYINGKKYVGPKSYEALRGYVESQLAL